MSESLPPIVHCGGPDQPPRLLRDVLRARIDAVPPGGEIAWATYYFRDRDLAQALIAASDRGVAVTLQVEGSPRRAGANAAVLAMLRPHGLGGGLHVHGATLPALHGHLHSKIYYFSGPEPVVLVGSFNPSGDDPEDADVIAEIGDQDRGHNLLVEFRGGALPGALRDHVLAMHRPFVRVRNTRALRTPDADVWFYPRFDVSIVERALAGAGDIAGCISHLKKGALVDCLVRAARSGAAVRLLVHNTGRRVPEGTVGALRDAGVDIRRFVHPEDLPLHAKFLLADGKAWFGSFNYNPRSRWLNREILLASEQPAIVDALSARFEAIAAAV
jgi:phosphatidylserine/phosphatidylglycerophosphate/cardiolipin synthase-like enzyme